MSANTSVIPPFRVEFTAEEIAQVLSYTESILQSGRLILGPYTEQFEQEFARITGCKYAIAVNSGTSALEIILRSLDVSGKEILVPTNTNFATAAAAIYAGAKVILYDSGLYPDFADIVKKSTSKTAAIIVVHIGGYITDELEKIQSFCAEKGFSLIEDAAHAHYASLNGHMAGSFGHASAFSFFPTKVITTCEGGMITTNDEVLYAQAQRYRDQGKDSSGMRHIVMGNSWRMSEIEASLGLVQLRSLDKDTIFRQEVMQRYQDGLAKNELFTFPTIPTEMHPSGYKCIAYLTSDQDRDEFKKKLEDKQVIIGRGVYDLPLHRQPIFAEITEGSFPIADEFSNKHICLPLWRFITDEQVEGVIQTINNFS